MTVYNTNDTVVWYMYMYLQFASCTESMYTVQYCDDVRMCMDMYVCMPVPIYSCVHWDNIVKEKLCINMIICISISSYMHVLQCACTCTGVCCKIMHMNVDACISVSLYLEFYGTPVFTM